MRQRSHTRFLNLVINLFLNLFNNAPKLLKRHFSVCTHKTICLFLFPISQQNHQQYPLHPRLNFSYTNVVAGFVLLYVSLLLFYPSIPFLFFSANKEIHNIATKNSN